MTRAHPTTVLIVDGDPMVRAGLRVMLSADDEIDVLAEAGDGVDAVAKTMQHRPDVVLLDMTTPVLGAVEVTRRIHSHAPRSSVVLLTARRPDGDAISEALASGAGGYFLKDVAPEVLCHGVHVASAGDSVISGEVLFELVSQRSVAQSRPRMDAIRRLRRLTDREWAVARAVAEGSPNGTIARELHMSVSTVKTHVSRVLTKAGLDNRVQLALLVHLTRERETHPAPAMV